MNQLVILGACGNAYDVLDIVNALNAQHPIWNVIGFLDDRSLAQQPLLGHEMLGPLERADEFSDALFINCIGSDHSHWQRPNIIGRLGLPASKFATLVHPLASVSPSARLGCGVYVSFGCSVGGNVELQDHVAVAPNVCIGHDSVIGAHCILAPASCVSGFVRVGPASYLGARCVVKQRTTIGAKSRVGMGAVVTRDVEPETTVVGVPARQHHQSVV